MMNNYCSKNKIDLNKSDLGCISGKFEMTCVIKERSARGRVLSREVVKWLPRDEAALLLCALLAGRRYDVQNGVETRFFIKVFIVSHKVINTGIDV